MRQRITGVRSSSNLGLRRAPRGARPLVGAQAGLEGVRLTSGKLNFRAVIVHRVVRERCRYKVLD